MIFGLIRSVVSTAVKGTLAVGVLALVIAAVSSGHGGTLAEKVNGWLPPMMVTSVGKGLDAVGSADPAEVARKVKVATGKMVHSEPVRQVAARVHEATREWGAEPAE